MIAISNQSCKSEKGCCWVGWRAPLMQDNSWRPLPLMSSSLIRRLLFPQILSLNTPTLDPCAHIKTIIMSRRLVKTFLSPGFHNSTLFFCLFLFLSSACHPWGHSLLQSRHNNWKQMKSHLLTDSQNSWLWGHMVHVTHFCRCSKTEIKPPPGHEPLWDVGPNYWNKDGFTSI